MGSKFLEFGTKFLGRETLLGVLEIKLFLEPGLENSYPGLLSLGSKSLSTRSSS